MKKIYLFFLFLGAVSVGYSQSLSLKVIPSNGGYATSGGKSLSWTIGEPLCKTLQSSNMMLTQGFQQPYFTIRIVNLKAFIQGYYLGSSEMQPVLLNEMVSGATSMVTDTIHIELHEVGDPSIVAESQPATLMTDGMASASFNGSLTGHSYWIAVKHRNAVSAWSAAPVSFGAIANYDFSISQTQSFGNNMTEVDGGIWALYSGDINQDENVDLFDFVNLYNDITLGLYGFIPTDLNGDGNADLLDYPFLDLNINNGLFSFHP